MRYREAENFEEGYYDYLDRDGAFLLDVRSEEEYETGHLRNAVNIPVGKLGRRTGDLPASKDVPVYSYCASGCRSRAACRYLNKLGYRDVTNLGGLIQFDPDLARLVKSDGSPGTM